MNGTSDRRECWSICDLVQLFFASPPAAMRTVFCSNFDVILANVYG